MTSSLYFTHIFDVLTKKKVEYFYKMCLNYYVKAIE